MSARKIRKADWLTNVWWVPLVVLIALAFVVVGLNLFGHRMPEWSTYVVLGAIVIACFFIWKRHDGRIWSRLLMTLAGLAVGLACVGAAYMSPYWNAVLIGLDPVTRSVNTEMYASAALEDLRYAMQYLQKVHPALINGYTDEVRTRYAQALGELQGRASISLMDFTRLLQSVIAPLNDPHTGISLTYSHTDEPHTLGTWQEHVKREDTLVAINGVPLENMLENVRDLIVYDSPAYGAARIADYAQTLEGLSYLGISAEDGVTYTWRRIDDVETDETVYTEDFLTPEAYEELYGDTMGSANDFVHWEIDQDNNVAILTLDACVNNDTYKDSLREMFAAIQEQGITNLAVDLRENSGGDSSVAEEFLRYINVPSYRTWSADMRLGTETMQLPAETVENKIHNDLVFNGNLYALTSPDTFSSGMMFAELIKDNHLGTLIGEEPGNDPNGYGDVVMFEMPNSKLLMSVSSKQWHRIDPSLQGLIVPDIVVPADEAQEKLIEVVQ